MQNQAFLINASTEERQLLVQLAAAVHRHEVTQLQIAEAVGMHQSQISRILAGKARRSSSNVKKLCKYASSLSEVDNVTHASHAQALGEAVTRIWDGSPAHAQALQEVLKAIGGVQATFRRDK